MRKRIAVKIFLQTPISRGSTATGDLRLATLTFLAEKDNRLWYAISSFPPFNWSAVFQANLVVFSGRRAPN